MGRFLAHLRASARWQQIAAPWLVVFALGCGGEAPAPPETPAALLTVDLDLGAVQVQFGDRSHELRFDAATATKVARRLREGLEQGQGADRTEAARRELGKLLLAGPDWLREVPLWQVAVSPWPRGLEQVGLLGHAIPPWEEKARPLGATHRIRFAPGTATDPPVRTNGKDVLLLAPFHPGFDAVHDDPDTLRWALREARAALSLVPRNDTREPVVRATLEESSPGLLWLRATSSSLRPLLAALDAGPALCVWTLPSPAVVAADEASTGVATLAPCLSDRGWFVQLWPSRDAATARLAADLFSQLRGGVEASEALRAVWPRHGNAGWIWIASAEYRLGGR